MVLNNVSTVLGGRPVHVRLSGNTIANVSETPLNDTLQIHFEDAIIFPGLVNSHDHLDFNLFPTLGDKLYSDYTEWGNYIHQNYKAEIAAVLKVPIALREEWGMIKNLLCGITTVVNHGQKLKGTHTLINIYERYHCLHSVGFEAHWKWKLNNPFKPKLPVVAHVGEGGNAAAHREIDALIRWNMLRKELIGVHAVAMDEEQAKKFKAIVWCPASNYFLLSKTAQVNWLKESTTVLFGTDSTLTGGWNIWNHIRLARELKMLDDMELYETLNANAAKIWKIGRKEIKPGADADLVIAKKTNGHTYMDAFFATNPEDILLVVQDGHIRLFDEILYGQLSFMELSAYHKIYINGIGKYVQADVPEMMKKIKQYYAEAVFPISS